MYFPQKKNISISLWLLLIIGIFIVVIVVCFSNSYKNNLPNKFIYIKDKFNNNHSSLPLNDEKYKNEGNNENYSQYNNTKLYNKNNEPQLYTNSYISKEMTYN